MAYEFVLKSDGRVLRRPTEIAMPGEVEIDIDPAILQTINMKVSRKIPNAITTPDGVLSLAMEDDDSCFVTLPLNRLVLKSNFKVTEKLIVPTFQGETDLTIPWDVPAGMLLYFVVYARRMPPYWAQEHCYLFALDSDNRKASYQLPLPNLYADCRLCTGDFNSRSETLTDTFKACLDQLVNGRWNNHIIFDNGNDRAKAAQKLFRWKPTKDGFETLIPAGNWRELSIPFGTDVLTRICLP